MRERTIACVCVRALVCVCVYSFVSSVLLIGSCPLSPSSCLVAVLGRLLVPLIRSQALGEPSQSRCYEVGTHGKKYSPLRILFMVHGAHSNALSLDDVSLNCFVPCGQIVFFLYCFICRPFILFMLNLIVPIQTFIIQRVILQMSSICIAYKMYSLLIREVLGLEVLYILSEYFISSLDIWGCRC